MMKAISSEAKSRIAGGIMGALSTMSFAFAAYAGGIAQAWWISLPSIHPNQLLVMGIALGCGILLGYLCYLEFGKARATTSKAKASIHAKQVVDSIPIMLNEVLLFGGVVVDGKYVEELANLKYKPYKDVMDRITEKYLTPEALEAFRDWTMVQVPSIEQPRSPMDKKLGYG